jgi:hypothetical protein
MDRQGTPSKMMEASLLYNLHGWRLDPKIKPLTHFEEAYTTTTRMVRNHPPRQPKRALTSPLPFVPPP